MTIEKKLTLKHLELPAPSKKGRLRPAIRVGNILRTSGQTSLHTGKVGKDLTVEQGCEAADEKKMITLPPLRPVRGTPR